MAIFAAGLITAAGASVVAYRLVGPYGDGPLDVGLYRTEDPETGRQLVYRDVPRPDGATLRYLFDDATRALTRVAVLQSVNGKLQEIGLRIDKGVLTQVEADGQTVATDAASGGMKVGFSLRGDGVIDAWQFRDPKGVLLKIEVSRHQDGKVDRWEYYENDQLARVELDDNRDGRVEHWQTYDAGILIAEAWDRDGDGKPDPGR